MNFVLAATLSRRHQAALQKSFEDLLFCTDVHRIINKLYTCQIITQDEYKKIQNFKDDTDRMERVILYSIMPGTIANFEKFLEIIEENNPEIKETVVGNLENLTESKYTDCYALNHKKNEFA